jgi:hypothetical protein
MERGEPPEQHTYSSQVAATSQQILSVLSLDSSEAPMG